MAAPSWTPCVNAAELLAVERFNQSVSQTVAPVTPEAANCACAFAEAPSRTAIFRPCMPMPYDVATWPDSAADVARSRRPLTASVT